MSNVFTFSEIEFAFRCHFLVVTSFEFSIRIFSNFDFLSTSYDFFAFVESNCYCGDFENVLGTVLDQSNGRQTIHFKRESVNKYLEEKLLNSRWIKMHSLHARRVKTLINVEAIDCDRTQMLPRSSILSMALCGRVQSTWAHKIKP